VLPGAYASCKIARQKGSCLRTGRTLHPEDVISRYRVVGPLGAGGMGEVYLAQDQSLERNVALKVLPPELVKDPDRVRRFVLEAKSASSLSHPNIVTIYEIGQDVVRSKDGTGDADSAPVQFMSMELINGKTLTNLIHEDKTDVRTTLGYLAQAAEGLAKAHATGIVHRDLKPGNIMVSADGFTKVLDFGLAKLTENRDPDPDSDSELSSAPTRLDPATGAGALIGTAGYMSPEQVQGKSVDHRSDIFSFGCVLYEAVTGQRPFVADTAVETMHKILHDKPAPVEERNPKAPGELRRVIRRCLAKSPDQRVQSMKDVALDLREIVDDWDTLSTSAGSGSTIVNVSGWAPAKPRLRPALIAAVSVLGLAALAVALFAYWQPRAGAPQPFQSMRMTTQTSRGDVTEAAISLDGRYLAYLTGEVGKSSVRVRQVATGSDVEVVPSEEGLFQGLSFSPDGNYLFYLKRRRDAPAYRALMQVPSLGGASREKAFDVDSRVSFSPEGKYAVFLRGLTSERKTNVVVLDLDTGQERVVTSIAQPHVATSAPAWSPDGRRIALVDLDTATGGFVSTLAVFDAESGHKQDVNVTKGAVYESLAWLADGTGIVRSGQDLGTSVARQISIVSYPGGRVRRLTNDFNDYVQVSTSSGDKAVAAVRFTRLSNLWLADVSGSEARPITTFTNAESSPFAVAPASDGSAIFAAARDQSLQLWLIATAGGEAKAITSGASLAINPRTVPGGVVFDRWDNDGGMHVWRVDLDGSHARMLTPSAPAQLRDVSRDGSVMTYIRLDGDRALWVMPLDGGPARSLGLDLNGGQISPDGRLVFVTKLDPGEGGLVHSVAEIIPVAGGEPVAKFPIPPGAGNPSWSPDSASLTFVDQADPAWNLARLKLTGGAAERMTRFDDGRTTAFRWSPDGSRLVVARKVGDAVGLWTTAADGSKPVQIARFPGDEVFGLEWSGDGKHILVNAGKRSSDAVLIRNFE
jgi:serine/threonine protein kinase/Tol biopolymer transport system component